MFRASLCPSSGAVVGPVQPDRPRPTALLPPCSYGKPVAAVAVDWLLMMGIRMPETCWTVSKRQAINLLLIAASSWLIYLNVWRCTDLQTLNPKDIPRSGYISHFWFTPVTRNHGKKNSVPFLSDLCQANYSSAMPLSQTSSSACVRTRKSHKIYLTWVS
jgi:hypothetical protein